MEPIIEIRNKLMLYLQKHSLSRQLLFGAISGVCAKSVIAPAERIKISYQISIERFALKHAFQRFLNIKDAEGWSGLWKGHSANIFRVAPYAGLHYAIHDHVELYLKDKDTGKITLVNQFIAGSAAGVGATTATYPLDVIRVRIAFDGNQHSSVGPNNCPVNINSNIGTNPAIGSAWMRAIQSGGLFQGFVPTILGSF